jgi:hypothetical protein
MSSERRFVLVSSLDGRAGAMKNLRMKTNVRTQLTGEACFNEINDTDIFHEFMVVDTSKIM